MLLRRTGLQPCCKAHLPPEPTWLGLRHALYAARACCCCAKRACCMAPTLPCHHHTAKPALLAWDPGLRDSKTDACPSLPVVKTGTSRARRTATITTLMTRPSGLHS